MRYGLNVFGKNFKVFEPVTLGFPPRYDFDKEKYDGCNIGENAVLRSGTIIYADVVIGDNFQTGHNVVIREKTTIGDNVSIGTGCIIEGDTVIMDGTVLQSMVYIPTGTMIGSKVFIGPNVVLTNDKYPPLKHGVMKAPIIGNGAVIGANSTILPGVIVGKNSMVAAGSVVTHNVPERMLAIGSPAVMKELPEEIKND
jgi:acetyltransferase-like isoleucine patch superfamily enzyme